MGQNPYLSCFSYVMGFLTILSYFWLSPDQGAACMLCAYIADSSQSSWPVSPEPFPSAHRHARSQLPPCPLPSALPGPLPGQALDTPGSPARHPPAGRQGGQDHLGREQLQRLLLPEDPDDMRHRYGLQQEDPEVRVCGERGEAGPRLCRGARCRRSWWRS